jgi:ATP-dependent DNA helicase RecG
MNAEYTLTTDAPRSIIVAGDNLGAFESTLPGQMSNEGYKMAFTRDNALLIRKLLTGRDVSISIKDKSILAHLADKMTERDKPNKYDWSTTLVDLTAVPLEGKFGKIKNEWDLLHYLPLRFIDKSNPQRIDELQVGGWSVIVGQIVNEPKYDYYREMIKVVVEDVSGKRISASFFKQKWLEYKYKHGDEVVLYGNYSEYVNQKGARYPQITNASLNKLTDVQGALPMIPIYPQKSGDKTQQLQREIYKFLEKHVWLEDPVPERILERYNLMPRNEAYRKLHFPANREDVDRARERLAFDEFVRLQVFFHNRRSNLETMGGRVKSNHRLTEAFTGSLPFAFTTAQQRVVKEIEEDLAGETPMYRLLQGDVGSGKTEIATTAALTSVGSGYQVAFMAPTDILASQLYDRMKRDLERAGLSAEVRVELLNGSMKTKERRLLLEGLKDGSIHIVVSTHAVIQKTVEFQDLGLVVIDELHRFGAEQRTILRENNKENGTPDMLLMSATPIPRSLSQTLYGDMSVSIVDELPAGRIPIETVWDSEPYDAWDRIREQVAEGHQAYVVASLVADSESESMADVESAISTYENLHMEFPGHTIGLLHGKLKQDEKEAVIDSFYKNEIQILVSTTVVEVGVNVPNATVMTILNANRFGIASLHQIRGRVGRGLAKSYCYLIGEVTNAEAEERLNALVSSTDGFYLAEKDLEIRGEGALFGDRQSGMAGNVAANLREHREILERAKKVAGAAASSKALQEEVQLLYKETTILA